MQSYSVWYLQHIIIALCVLTIADTGSGYTSTDGVILGPFSSNSTRHCLTVSVTDDNESLILSLSLKNDLLDVKFNHGTTLIKIIDDDDDDDTETSG